MPYRRRALTTNTPALPAPSMPALEPIDPDGPHQAQAALDTLVSSCRVLGSYGLQGATTFTVPDDENPASASRFYPDEDTSRVFLRLQGIPLTPGHIVGLDVVSLPCGPTQYEKDTGQWMEAGRGGQIQIDVTYTNSDADTVDASASVTPSSSVAVFGAEPASPFDALHVQRATASPFGLVPSAVDRGKFARGGDVLVDVVGRIVGAPRPVHVAVVERPSSIVVDLTSSEWPSNMYSNGAGPYEHLPTPYPATALSSTDPGGGTGAIRRALEQHGLQLGPCLAWWTSAQEKYDTLLDWDTDDEAPSYSSTSSSFVVIPYGSAVTANFPSFPSGGYARQARDSDAFLDGRTGVLPVWAMVYAKATLGAFQWRVGTTEWSAIDLPVTGGSWGWVIRPGWVETGTCVEDGLDLRLLGKRTGSLETWEVRYGGVFMRQR